MNNNHFTVDLGKLTLTDAQVKSINAAIQGAVVKELANIGTPDNVALVPVYKFPHGPLINGIIAFEHLNITADAVKYSITAKG